MKIEIRKKIIKSKTGRKNLKIQDRKKIQKFKTGKKIKNPNKKKYSKVIQMKKK